MPPSLSALVRQHAETARLLGVDFVPAYRTRAAAEVEVKPDDDLPQLAPAAPAIAGARATPLAPAQPATQTTPPAAPALFSSGPKGVHATPLVARPTSRDRAAVEASLAQLRARYEHDAPHAPFITSFTNLVFGEGDCCSPLMFVGEAPGEDEDKAGRPFVGRSGQLLEKMITAMGLSREKVYIANVLKVRPPDNATPTLDEMEASKPYLLEQIAIIAPKAIVTLGKTASQCLLMSNASMTSMRGRWHELSFPAALRFAGTDAPATVPVMPTFHPAYLLRSYTIENRQKVWDDIQVVMDRLGMKKDPQ